MKASEVGFLILAAAVILVVNLFHLGQTDQKVEREDIGTVFKIIGMMIGIIIVGKVFWWIIE